jgi:starch-binding outer membrane protein, SusD/RagB family
MKVTKIIASLCVVAFLASMYSCQKDWLSPPPENTLIATDSTFTDTENAERFVNSCYAQLTDWQVSVFSWTGVSSIASDDADKGSDPGDLGTDKDQMDNLTYGPTTLSITEVWNGQYVGIGRCNQAIENVPKFDIPEADKNKLLGEAKFLRAWYYFNLVRIYGGVPLISRVFNADQSEELNASYIRASEDAVYDKPREELTKVLPRHYLLRCTFTKRTGPKL